MGRVPAQFARRQLPCYEKITYSKSWSTRSQRDERAKREGCVSERTSAVDEGNCIDGSALPGVSSIGLTKSKPAATPKYRKKRQCDHSAELDGCDGVSDPLLKRRPVFGSRHHATYIPVSQASFARSICSLLPAARDSGRQFSNSATAPAALGNHQTKSPEIEKLLLQMDESLTKEPKIREKLRRWEAEYQDPKKVNFPRETMLSKIALARHSQSEEFDDEGDECDFEESTHPTYERGDIVGLDSQAPYLLRGDMVELRASSRIKIELAIFVRAIGSQYQYYTMSGKWIHQKPRLAKFCVPGFVDPGELDPLLAFLPSKSVPEALQHKLQSFENALPRDVGSPLIKKMLDFWNESDRIYRDAAFNLDNAHQIVAHKSNMRYASLPDLAHELLSKNYLKDGQFPTQVLYAVHRSIMLDELGFRPQKWNHRTTNQFEIVPICEIESSRTIANEMRKYQEQLIDPTQAAQSVQTGSTARFLEFLRKSRHKISQSRRIRKYTPYGMVGPAKCMVGDGADAETPEMSEDQANLFDTFDLRYVRFIASWAALRTFHSHSHLHGIASAILRATGMYHDTVLDQRVGWTFLQEVGAIAPWENRTHFDMRLLSAMSQIMSPEEQPKTEIPKQPDPDLDVLNGLRKDWGNLPVYCIDDIGASEIDDGISIEPTNMADEFWIHVHVADPASMIEPGSEVAQNAMAAMRTTYLPDRVIGMLPGDLVQQYLSLAPDRRCLTFSGRVSTSGRLLDTKVTPGRLHNIIFMTPATLSKVIGEVPSVLETVCAVGDDTATPLMRSPRRVTECHEVTELDGMNLNLLHKLGKARQSLSSARGSLMFSSSSFQITVATDGDSKEYKGLIYSGHSFDPRVELKVEKRDPDEKAYGNTVMNLMLLAGEVGARWCQERGIPVINRVSHPHPDDLDPREYFRRTIAPLLSQSKELDGEVQNLTIEVKEEVTSLGDKAGSSRSPSGDVTAPTFPEASTTIPLDIALMYQRLLGVVAPSTMPGPHLHLGLDMFTRTTSPLRRYSDLLVHWQVEAALLEEARLGESLIGSTRDDFLPFKRHELDRFIPILDGKEREMNSNQRDAQRVWAIQMLLRAWKFDQAPLPQKFELWTNTFESKTVRGGLTYFGGLSATFELPKWISEEDVRVGDVFEVTLANLDVYNRRIEVTPLRRVRRTSGRAI